MTATDIAYNRELLAGRFQNAAQIMGCSIDRAISDAAARNSVSHSTLTVERKTYAARPNRPNLTQDDVDWARALSDRMGRLVTQADIVAHSGFSKSFVSDVIRLKQRAKPLDRAILDAAVDHALVIGVGKARK